MHISRQNLEDVTHVTINLAYLDLQPCGVMGCLWGVAQGLRVVEGFQSSSHWHCQTGLAAF